MVDVGTILADSSPVAKLFDYGLRIFDELELSALAKIFRPRGFLCDDRLFKGRRARERLER